MAGAKILGIQQDDHVRHWRMRSPGWRLTQLWWQQRQSDYELARIDHRIAHNVPSGPKGRGAIKIPR